jgi:hypothetical protein
MEEAHLGRNLHAERIIRAGSVGVLDYVLAANLARTMSSASYVYEVDSPTATFSILRPTGSYLNRATSAAFFSTLVSWFSAFQV